MLNITACGYLAADPRNNVVGDNEVTNFLLLVNKKIKDREIVTAVDCSVWGRRAVVAAQYLSKGCQITVSGQAHTETYERKDGGVGCKLVLRVDDFTLPVRPKEAEHAPEEEGMPF
jgi:single-stranded DNA-binding protein